MQRAASLCVLFGLVVCAASLRAAEPILAVPAWDAPITPAMETQPLTDVQIAAPDGLPPIHPLPAYANLRIAQNTPLVGPDNATIEPLPAPGDLSTPTTDPVGPSWDEYDVGRL